MAVPSLMAVVPSNEAVLCLGPRTPKLSLVGEGLAGRLLEREEVSMCSVEIELGIATPLGACLILPRPAWKSHVVQGMVATAEFKGLRFDL